MNTDGSVAKDIHYHIRWLASDTFDWQCHETRAEAETSAQGLVRRGEEYVIEAFGDVCPSQLRRPRTAEKGE